MIDDFYTSYQPTLSDTKSKKQWSNVYISVPQFYFERSRILKEPNIFWMIQFLAIWRSLAGIMPTDDVHYKEKMTTWFEIFIQLGRDLSISLSKLYITSLVYITIEADHFFRQNYTSLESSSLLRYD